MSITAWVFMFSLAVSPPAGAPALPGQAGATEPTCPPGNLLAGKRPVAWQDIRGSIALPTDGKRAPEGAFWEGPAAAVLDTGAATFTWDLGAPVRLAAAWVQADNNDRYTVWGSSDGREFAVLARLAEVGGPGLRGRALRLSGDPVRYLRFGEGEGDGAYALSEIQVFCAPPAPFPPEIPVAEAPSGNPPFNIHRVWNDETSARWQLVLAVLGYALLAWGPKLRRQGRPEAYRRLRHRLLLALGALSALTFVNFGFFHFGNFLHAHEWTHYYLGAKYFDELGYQRLYECVSIADAEDGLRRRVELRPITNLRSNVIEKTDDVLAHPERCKRHFSPRRWTDFKRDIAFFRQRLSPKYWDRVQLDHGYNATPLWNAIGGWLANLSPASPGQVYLLALLDPLCLLGALALVGWAFGGPTLSVALLVFATNFPSRFYWTGGAFLRWDWLFFLVATLAFLKKGRPGLAGAALAAAAGLRIFPGLLFLGPLLAVAGRLFRRQGIPSEYRRFFVGGALAGTLLFSLSLAGSGGMTTYARFAENTEKHRATPLANNMGLRMVLTWRPFEEGRTLYQPRALDSWARWKQARTEAWPRVRPLAVVLALGLLLLLARAARRTELWALVTLGITFIPFAVDLTSYYYAFVLGLALLAAKREEIGRWLLLLTAFTQLVAWAPLRGMSLWQDEQYTWMSLATLLVFAAVAWRFAHPPGEADGRGGGPGPATPGSWAGGIRRWLRPPG